MNWGATFPRGFRFTHDIRSACGATDREGGGEHDENGRQGEERDASIDAPNLSANAKASLSYARGDHDAGQLIDSSAGLKQLSVRSGSFPRRI